MACWIVSSVWKESWRRGGRDEIGRIVDCIAGGKNRYFLNSNFEDDHVSRWNLGGHGQLLTRSFQVESSRRVSSISSISSRVERTSRRFKSSANMDRHLGGRQQGEEKDEKRRGKNHRPLICETGGPVERRRVFQTDANK